MPSPFPASDGIGCHRTENWFGVSSNSHRHSNSQEVDKRLNYQLYKSVLDVRFLELGIPESPVCSFLVHMGSSLWLKAGMLCRLCWQSGFCLFSADGAWLKLLSGESALEGLGECPSRLPCLHAPGLTQVPSHNGWELMNSLVAFIFGGRRREGLRILGPQWRFYLQTTLGPWIDKAHSDLDFISLVSESEFALLGFLLSTVPVTSSICTWGIGGVCCRESLQSFVYF